MGVGVADGRPSPICQWTTVDTYWQPELSVITHPCLPPVSHLHSPPAPVYLSRSQVWEYRDRGKEGVYDVGSRDGITGVGQWMEDL